MLFVFFFSSRRRHTRFDCDWSSDVCSSDLQRDGPELQRCLGREGFKFTYPTGWKLFLLDRCSISSRRKGYCDHRFQDRKSTRLNSSHSQISYAVFCLKKKKKKKEK